MAFVGWDEKCSDLSAKLYNSDIRQDLVLLLERDGFKKLGLP
jgi:hypothetical protein